MIPVFSFRTSERTLRLPFNVDISSGTAATNGTYLLRKVQWFFGCIIILHRKRQLFHDGRTLRTKWLSAGYEVSLDNKTKLLERSYLTF